MNAIQFCVTQLSIAREWKPDISIDEMRRNRGIAVKVNHQNDILAVLNKHGALTRSQVAKHTGKTERTAKEYLTQLVSDGKVVMIMMGHNQLALYRIKQ